MENTYTYIARNVEKPEQVVTFTLQDHHMSVGMGPPLEQIELALEQAGAGDRDVAEEGQAVHPELWLRPAAVSLLERGVGPFRLADVSVDVEDDWLRVSAWYRAGGLALVPVKLLDGRVDNAPAAQAFAEELDKRKSEVKAVSGPLKVLDYWFTWILVLGLILGLFQIWRRKADS